MHRERKKPVYSSLTCKDCSKLPTHFALLKVKFIKIPRHSKRIKQKNAEKLSTGDWVKVVWGIVCIFFSSSLYFCWTFLWHSHHDLYLHQNRHHHHHHHHHYITSSSSSSLAFALALDLACADNGWKFVCPARFVYFSWPTDGGASSQLMTSSNPPNSSHPQSRPDFDLICILLAWRCKCAEMRRTYNIWDLRFICAEPK